MTTGQKIGILRNAMQLSQEQLAEKINVSRQSVSKWEADITLPEIPKVLLLAALFNVTTDDLLKEETALSPCYTEPLFKPAAQQISRLKYFGTDGFRGEANVELTADHAYKIGRFLGWYYSGAYLAAKDAKHKTRVVVGKDTRRSSYMLEYALVAGLTASGADVYMLHVTTTPGVSYVVRQDGFECGVMISASHNPYYDNGIKLVDRTGDKADDGLLSLIEAYIDGNMTALSLSGDDLPLARRENIGCITDYVAGRNRYVGFLISVAAKSYRGKRIALDCANGSAWMIAKSVFDALGASTFVINANPNGININVDAGSTGIGSLRKFVRENKMDCGFAFDGDADRCIAVDENGGIVNGDHILYILAKRLKDKGLLPGNTVVTTIMSNIGLYKALENEGIDYVQTTVGDRYVYEKMMQNNFYLGGEQTGHIIIRKYAATGDGILTAIMLTEEMTDKKTSLSSLCRGITIYPQAVKNIFVSNKAAVCRDESVLEFVNSAAKKLGGEGRIILRESGTEPVVRVMIESKTQKTCDAYAAAAEQLIKSLGYCK